MSASFRFAEVIATNINAIRKVLSEKVGKFTGFINVWTDACQEKVEVYHWVQGFFSSGDKSLDRTKEFLLDHEFRSENYGKKRNLVIRSDRVVTGTHFKKISVTAASFGAYVYAPPPAVSAKKMLEF
jgi:hypothetical protein